MNDQAPQHPALANPQTGQVERVLDLPTPAALDERLRTWGQQPLSVGEQEAIVALLAKPVVAVPALVGAFRALRDHQDKAPCTSEQS